MMCWAVKWRIMLSLYWTHGILMDGHQIKQTVTPLLVSVLTLPITLMGGYHACKYKDTHVGILQYSIFFDNTCILFTENILCLHIVH